VLEALGGSVEVIDVKQAEATAAKAAESLPARVEAQIEKTVAGFGTASSTRHDDSNLQAELSLPLIHETGHVFMALAVGFTVHEVDVVQDPPVTSYSVPPLDPEEDAWRSVLVEVSGWMCETIHANGDLDALMLAKFIRDSKDARAVREYLKALGDEEARVGALATARDVAESFLRANWDDLIHLAAELDREGICSVSGERSAHIPTWQDCKLHGALRKTW